MSNYAYAIQYTPTVHKIGHTDSPARRLRELSLLTAMPIRFVKVINQRSGMARWVEYLAHLELRDRRITGEFFDIDEATACAVLERAARNYAGQRVAKTSRQDGADGAPAEYWNQMSRLFGEEQAHKMWAGERDYPLDALAQ